MNNHFMDLYLRLSTDPETFLYVSKLVANYLKSFNVEIEPELKTSFKQFFLSITEYYKTTKGHLFSINAILSIVHRLVVILGGEAIDIVKWMLFEELMQPPLEVFEEATKLVISSVQLLKGNMKSEAIQAIMLYFEVVRYIPLSAEINSEIERNNWAVVGQYGKMVGAIAFELPEIFYSENLNAKELFDYLDNLAIFTKEVLLKKQTLKIYKNVLTTVKNNVEEALKNQSERVHIYLDYDHWKKDVLS